MTFFDEDDLVSRYSWILDPISAEAPAGEDVRYARWRKFDFGTLKELRRGDYHPGRMGPDSGIEQGTDWTRVELLATEALERCGKDLQLAIWLIEAKLHAHGFQGLYEGLFLLRQLIERFWDAGLYPRGSEDDELPDEERTSLLEWFAQELPVWIKSLPLTPETHGRRYSLSDFSLLKMRAEARRHDFWEEAMPAREELFEVYRKLRETPAFFFGDRLEGIARVREQLAKLAYWLQGRNQDIPLDRATYALEDYEAPLTRWSRGEIGEPDPSAPPEPVDPETIEDPWHRALAWLRLRNFENAAGLIEATLSAATSERQRFFYKFELANAVIDAERWDLAISLLESLDEQIEQFHLHAWEQSGVAMDVWKLLYDCYQSAYQKDEKVSKLEAKLSRVAPWKMLH